MHHPGTVRVLVSVAQVNAGQARASGGWAVELLVEIRSFGPYTVQRPLNRVSHCGQVNRLEPGI
jgi:hypothetical protein